MLKVAEAIDAPKSKRELYTHVRVIQLKQVELTKHDEHQEGEAMEEKELIPEHALVMTESFEKEIRSSFSPEMVSKKESCPEMTFRGKKIHGAHQLSPHGVRKIISRKKMMKCFKSWKFKFKSKAKLRELVKVNPCYKESVEAEVTLLDPKLKRVTQKRKKSRYFKYKDQPKVNQFLNNEGLSSYKRKLLETVNDTGVSATIKRTVHGYFLAYQMWDLMLQQEYQVLQVLATTKLLKYWGFEKSSVLLELAAVKANDMLKWVFLKMLMLQRFQNILQKTIDRSKKFQALQHRVYQVLANKPQPGLVTFIVQCLNVLPVFGIYGEGCRHLVKSALRRYFKSASSPATQEVVALVRRLAVLLFLAIAGESEAYYDKLIVNTLKVFDVGLTSIDEALSASEVWLGEGFAYTGSVLLEEYISGLIKFKYFMMYVSLLEHSSFSFPGKTCLQQRVEDKDFHTADQWVCWDVAKTKTKGSKQLLEYLVYLAMEIRYYEKVYELGVQYSPEDLLKAQEVEVGFIDKCFFHLNDIAVEEVDWAEVEIQRLVANEKRIEMESVMRIIRNPIVLYYTKRWPVTVSQRQCDHRKRMEKLQATADLQLFQITSLYFNQRYGLLREVSEFGDAHIRSVRI